MMKSSWPSCSTSRERSIREGNEAAMMKSRTNDKAHQSEQERSTMVVGAAWVYSVDVEAFRPLRGDIESEWEHQRG